MHITHVIFKKSLGGAERAFVDYCRLSLDLGYEVSAIVHPACKRLKDLDALGIPYRKIRYIGGWAPLSRLKARWALDALKPDVIVCHGSKPADLLHGLRPSIPLIGVGHVYKNVDRFAQLKVPVIALTQDMEAYARTKGIPENHIFRLSNVVYLESFSPHDYTRHTPFQIGSMGRFAHSKGFDVLIEALGILHEKGYLFRCDIGGTGHRKGELERQVESLGLKEKVILHNWIEDVGSFLDSLDLFCFPSRHEPFGLALLEALARGLPIVSSDAEGPREILTPEHDALVVEKGAPQTLARALERIITHPLIAENLGRQARKTFEARFHPQVIAQELKRILQTLLELPHPSKTAP